MKLVQGGAARRHSGRNDEATPTGSVPGGPAAAAGTDPGQAAAAEVATAYDHLADAEAAVRVARAREAEIRSATPRLHPRLAAAADALEAAQAADHEAQSAVVEGQRELADRKGAVLVAEARVDDLSSSPKPVTDGQRVGAEQGLAKAERARDRADAILEASGRQAERTTQRLAAAQEHLQEVRQDTGPESSKVLAAVEAVRKAERDRDRAQARYAAAQREQQLAAKVAPLDPQSGQPVQHFYDLEEFVVEYLLPNWEHKIDRRTHWCARWWAHPAAVTRLGHVWEAFEAARREPAPAMSSWWRDHVDHHMGWLTSQDGPFELCDSLEDVHKRQPLWSHNPSEDGMFPGNDDAETEQVRRHALDSVLTQREGSSDESHA